MRALGETDLLAVRMPPGQPWMPLLARALQAGPALLPLDPRLPDAAARALLERMRPAALLDGEAAVALADPVPVDPDIALVVATSGTAGAPKGVELTRAAIGAAVNASNARLGARAEDPWLCAIPLSHIAGLLVLARAHVAGASVRIHDGFDPDAVARDADGGFISLVPAQLHRLLEAHAPLHRFAGILVGGAALDPAMRARAKEAGARIVETYGMTESCGGVVYDGVPLDGTDVTIANNEQILLRGPTRMRGYRLDEAATRAAVDPDGWLHTRDAGAFAADGRLAIHGRLDDVIVTGGEKVWPGAVEEALRAHPQIADVAVTGARDETWGARVVAIVVPRDAASPPTLASLRDVVAATLPRYAAPREVVFAAAIPRTASGKIARATLRAPR